MTRNKYQHRVSGGVCMCPECDNEIPHSQGTPCPEERCPDCGAPMIRKNSERHRTGSGPAKVNPDIA